MILAVGSYTDINVTEGRFLVPILFPTVTPSNALMYNNAQLSTDHQFSVVIPLYAFLDPGISPGPSTAILFAPSFSNRSSVFFFWYSATR